MTTSQVNLTAAINANLLSLQSTQQLLNQTQLALSTGKKVNSALDNPEAFFAAQALTNRSGDLGNVLDSISQGVQTIQTANDGITSITALLQQAQSVATQALSESNSNAGGAPSDVNSLVASFNQILTQITNLANDASYQGSNLINSTTSTLTITYDETGKSQQTIQGVNLTAGGTGTQGTGYAGPITGSISLPSAGPIAPALVGTDTLTVTNSLGVTTNVSIDNTTTAAQVVSALNAAGSDLSASLNNKGDLVINSTALGANVTVSGTGAADVGLVATTTNAQTAGGGLGIVNVSSSGSANTLNWGAADAADQINATLSSIASALVTVRGQASNLGQNLSTVQVYQSFDQHLINDLNTGSNDLTAADTNEESAALLTLQTQQQLGISALSLASQAQQAVLKLFP
jgi:flagellin-like hook-associated protein FlgL